MKIANHLKVAAIAALAVTAASSGDVVAKNHADFLNRYADMHSAMRRLAPNANMAMSERTARIDQINSAIDTRTTLAAPAQSLGPDLTVEPHTYFGDIDGPDGEMWYYTQDCEMTYIDYEYFRQNVVQEYTFNIYNSNMEYVGSIHDKFRYRDDESHHAGSTLAGVSLLPVVTKNYFNSDGKYEFVVCLATNFKDRYGARSRSVVYSLDGEKETVKIPRQDGTEDTVEVDKPVAEIDGFICDVLDVSTPAEENFLFTFIDDIYVEVGDDETGPAYWDRLTKAGSEFNTFAKAGADGNLRKVFSKRIPALQQQGNMEDTPPIMTFNRNGQGYIVCPYYKEPFYNPYYSYDEDASMRENNALVIELYKISSTGHELVNTTEVPVSKQDKDGVMATYFSVGDFRYNGDVVIDADGTPSYVVTRCNYQISQDGITDYCFYAYKADGSLAYTIFENADSNLSLYSIEGQPEAQMFVQYDEFDGYVYHIVDIASGKRLAKINALIDTGLDDFETMLANMDRVNTPDGPKYAFEMRAPLTDENDNTFMRIAWFDAKGCYERMDYVALGQSVQYAKAYMSGAALSATLFNDDSLNEYLVLVKRGVAGEQATEELLIGQGLPDEFAEASTILHLTPDAVKGNLNTIGLYPGTKADDLRLVVYYLNGDNKYSVDMYELPFATSSITDAVGDVAQGAITFDGSVICAPGLTVSVYNPAGALVATAAEKVDAATLPAGVYVAKAGTSAVKFAVK